MFSRQGGNLEISDPWLINRYLRQKDAITAALILIIGFPILLIPLVPNIYCFYIFLYLSGVGASSVSTAAGSDCLDIWRGGSGGDSAMYAMNFGFAFGTLIGPLLATSALQVNGGMTNL